MRWFISLAVLALSFAAAVAEPIAAGRIRVIDGDTIRVDGARPDVRLVGYNAPETRRARSEYERDLGGKATRRLREILRGAKAIDLAIVPCACRAGTEGTTRCNYGRRCGRLTADGRDVGEVLIAEGLAAKYECGPRSCPRATGPWRE